MSFYVITAKPNEIAVVTSDSVKRLLATCLEPLPGIRYNALCR